MESGMKRNGFGQADNKSKGMRESGSALAEVRVE
jgi:hypothetical protein